MDINRNKLRLTIADVRKSGYLQGSGAAGVLCWKKDGSVIASLNAVSFITDDGGSIGFRYTHCGDVRECTVTLRRYRSNIPNCTGSHYYFVCPVTGRLCRNLYFSNGIFMSRAAFGGGAMYEQQEQSRKQRNAMSSGLMAYLNMALLLEQRNRRETYMGKATPYGRRVAKLFRKAAPALDLTEQKRNELEGVIAGMLI